MTEKDLPELFRVATEDISASDDLRRQLEPHGKGRQPTSRRWWVAGRAAVAAPAGLVGVPGVRSRPTAPPEPAVATTDPVPVTSTPTSTRRSAGPSFPSAADVTACRTHGALVKTETPDPVLLCLVVRSNGSEAVTPTGEHPSITGDMIIGRVADTAVPGLLRSFSQQSPLLCLQFYPLSVVADGLARDQMTGCNQGAPWQRAIDDAADQITWAAADPTGLCQGTAPPQPSPAQGSTVRLVVVCGPNLDGRVLTGSAATAVAVVSRMPSTGATCAPADWSIITVQDLSPINIRLPTVQTPAGCALAPELVGLIDDLTAPDPRAVPNVAGLSPADAIKTLTAAGFDLTTG